MSKEIIIKKIVLVIMLAVFIGMTGLIVYTIANPVKDYVPNYKTRDSSFEPMPSKSGVRVEGFAYYAEGTNDIVALKFSIKLGSAQQCTSEYKKHPVKHDLGYYVVEF